MKTLIEHITDAIVEHCSETNSLAHAENNDYAWGRQKGAERLAARIESVMRDWEKYTPDQDDPTGALKPRIERAEQACKTLMRYEDSMDGCDDGSAEPIYWQAVREARAAVGDYVPE